MKHYRLEVLGPREELQFRREFQAASDGDAIDLAVERFKEFAAALPERFVLYEGKRVVHEHVGRL